MVLLKSSNVNNSPWGELKRSSSKQQYQLSSGHSDGGQVPSVSLPDIVAAIQASPVSKNG